MVPLKRLYILAGFDDHDVERQAAALQRQYQAGSSRVIGRTYPVKPEKRAAYLQGLVKSANNLIFGEYGATNFCRRLDQPCAREVGKTSRRTCDSAKDGRTACARSRPQLVVVICADQLFTEVFDRLGRGTLIMRLAASRLPSVADLKARLDAFEPIAEEVVATISRRAKSLYSPLLPSRNFQRLGPHDIAGEVQATPSEFAAIMTRYHERLYDGKFKNPRKSGVRGAYMLDADTGFQEDHLHRVVQAIGAASREDGFHLFNAYHVYGVKADPGFHFDIMKVDGGAVGDRFEDRLTGAARGGGETHLNATPCDRIL